MPEKNKSYAVEDKRKPNNIKIGKKEGEIPFIMKKLNLQDENKGYEKFSSNFKFKTSKSNNIDKREREREKEKEREHNKNIINNLNAKKNKLKQLLEQKKK